MISTIKTMIVPTGVPQASGKGVRLPGVSQKVSYHRILPVLVPEVSH